MRPLAIILLLLIVPSASVADIITSTWGVPDAEEAWAYSRKGSVGQGNSTTWAPSKSSWSGAAFQGYVAQTDEAFWSTNDGGAPEQNPDTIYIFKTWIQSDADITVQMQFHGDDGHILYIDDVLEIAAPFYSPHVFDLVLTAGEPRKLEMAFYNGVQYGSVFFFRTETETPITTIPGIHVNADGLFPIPVQETTWGDVKARFGHAGADTP